MFSFLVKIKRRIKKLLKVQSETRQRPQSSFHSRTLKFLLLILVSLLVATIYPGRSLFDPLDMPRRGEIALEDVIAPFEITVMKTDREVSDEIEDTKLAIPFVIDYDSTIVKNAYTGLDRFFRLVDSLKKNVSGADTAVSRVRLETVAKRFPLMSESAITESFRRNTLAAVASRLKNIFDTTIYRIGVLPDGYSLPESRNKNVVIRRGDRQNMYSRDRLYSVEDAILRLLTALSKIDVTDSIDVEYHFQVGRNFIQPNLRINMAEYNRRVDEALASISRVKEVVEKNDIILRSGQRINARQERVLREMARMLRTQESDQPWAASVLPALARLLLVLAAFSVLYLFLYYFRRDVFKSNAKLLALFMVFGLQLFLIYLIGTLTEASIYLYPVALLPILVTILFDAEIGILSTVVLALLLGIMHRFDFTLTFMTISVGTVASLTSGRVRKRTQFFRIMYSVAFTFAAYSALVETLKLVPNTDLLVEVGYGVVNGIVTSLLAIGILPFFESLFGFTTDITLLELSDPNHPLLKRLALEAPGTYHHSIIVGNLCEAAATAIGANPLLARVGAYFHDIGKIEIPEYFVENQLSVKSKHDELTPSMSSIILSSHVKMGRQLGEEAGIPDDVLNFIEEHHGTMVQSYFYNRAREQGANEAVVDKFRYPGPKPQTRETGIAMLADAIEAASRTLDDPKPARINNLIQRIINERFQSGELDQCPLTLRDLARIKEAFAQVLIGAFHHRVVYPKKEKTDEE
ncbi:MAG: HDIG domain-containing metalloprotein [Candidatus Zixiibacteriota bacterium]